MTIPDFAYTPADGIKNTTSFPTSPGSNPAARLQFQTLFDQVTTYLNDTLIPAVAEGSNNFGASAAGTDAYAITLADWTGVAYATGQTAFLKADVANTGAATFAINAVAAVAIRKSGTTVLEDGDIAAGATVLLKYDGTYWQLQGLSSANDILTKLKTVDGAGSGLDSDLLDGQQGSYYAPAASPTFTGLVTTAGQIKFPAIANPSADVNTLDDYEEGTWEAAFACSTSGTITIDNSYKTGAYTKIGRQVTVTGLFIVDSVSSPVGALALTGLPFAVGAGNQNRVAVAVIGYGLEATATMPPVGRIDASASLIQIDKYAAAAPVAMAGDVKAGSTFFISTTYFV